MGEKLTGILAQLEELRRLGIIKPKGYDLVSPWSPKARLRLFRRAALTDRGQGEGSDG